MNFLIFILLISECSTFYHVTHFDQLMEQSCKLLKTKLNKEFGKNLDKFDLYASRNIFALPVPESADLATEVYSFRFTYVNSRS